MTEDEFNEVYAALDDFMAMNPPERSYYYYDFFEDWDDLTDAQLEAFWEFYDLEA